MANDGILLESGTDEVEILEFVLGGQGFGVNVMKIQAIEQYDPKRVTRLPVQNGAIAGMFLFRNHTIPLIDLSAELGIQTGVSSGDHEQDVLENGQDGRVVLVTQFNSLTNAFLVDGVRRIHRVMWEKVSPLSSMLAGYAKEFTGSVWIEDREVLIVDMEKISGDYFPADEMLDLGGPEGEHLKHPRQDDRPNVRILLAEDSSTVRQMILGVLEKGGYTNVTVFENGKEAYDALEKIKTDAQQGGPSVTDAVNLVITDIEMPKMDGLTLCHHIKHRLAMNDVRVVMYSSLMKEQMASKCNDVKADAYITKPQCVRLVQMLDALCIEGRDVGSIDEL
jgi:two-component system chemotaxis response regulator CheV